MSAAKLPALLIASLTILGLCTDAVAAPIQWIDPGTDDWTDGANWSPFPPGGGDSVDISNGGTAYLATTTPYTIDDLVLGDSFGQSGSLELRPGAALPVGSFVVVGGRGMGHVRHLAGLLGTETLAVGATTTGVGTYDMAGGQVDAYHLIVGDSGLGSFDQQGGWVQVGYYGLQIGWMSSGVGTYSIGGPSQLSVDGPMRVGEWGLGRFVQDGGQVSVTGGPMSLGCEAGASGTYQIGFGILQTVDLLIGERGAGSFAHENGAVRAQSLMMGTEATGAGHYSLAGGSLQVQDNVVIGLQGEGSFIQTGGAANVGTSGGPVLVLGQFAGSSATYQLEGAASQLNLSGDMVLGSEGSGTFTQQGGSVTAQYLVLGERFSGSQPGSGSYALSGGNVRLDQNLIVGYEGVGSFTQTGGRVSADYVYLGLYSTGPDTSRGSYDISDGELNAEYGMTVGRSGIGAVKQTGGSVVVGGALELARYSSSQGTYAISGGTLDAAEIRFGDGDGTFALSGTGAVTTGNIDGSDRGVLIVDGGSLTNYGAIQDVRTFMLGSEAGSDGAYTSVNHTSVTETFVVGDAGRGHYTQQSGATYGPGGSPAATFVVGNGAAGEGTITVQDGGFYYDELIVGKAGAGAYEQFNGSAQGGILSLGTEATGQGSVHVHGGDLEAQEVYVGGLGTAAFHQDGGTVSVHSLLVLGDAAGREGTYNLSRASGGPIPELQVQGMMIVGEEGTGTFNHDGGYVRSFDSSHLLILGDHAGSQGTYNLTGPPTDADPPGMIDSRGMLIVGGAGTGTFNQTDGFTRVVFRQEVVLGAGPGSHGTYNLNGSGPALPPASLSATDRLVVGRYGTGVFHHQGAENASVYVGNDLVLGEFPGSQGAYEMTIAEIGVGGPAYQLEVNGNLFVGMGGIGAYHQTGGQSSFNRIHLGSQPTGQGTLTLSDGLIETGPLYVGASGSPGATGAVVQEGGKLWAHGPVYIGRDPGTQGSYTLIDGVLETAAYLWVGYRGQGEFVQQGGDVLVPSFVRIGAYEEGEYRMAGGSLNAASLTVGFFDDGTFVQQGGDVLVQNRLVLGEQSSSGIPSTGRYSISGGTLQADDLVIGEAGAGEFSQTGGDVIVQQGVYLQGTPELSGNYTMTGGTLSAGFVQIGDGHALTISNGSQAETGAVYLAQPSWMTGRIAVANGSSWTNHGSLTLGDLGTATLEVSGGSTATVDGAAPIMMALGFPSTANVTVDGNGSRLLTDGDITAARDGTANVTVSGGGQIRSNQGIVLSEGVSGRASLSVSGAGSEVSTKGEVRLAEQGTADVAIANGGKVRAGWDGLNWNPSYMVVAAGDTSSAQVAVLGAGSELAAGGNMFLGGQGTVALNVADGGSVSSGNYQGVSGVLAMALASTAEVTATVDGFGSAIAGGDYFDVGVSGHATIRVTNGGKLSAGRSGSSNPGIFRMALAPHATADVRVEGPGSRMEADEVFVGGHDSGSGGSAALELRNAAVLDTFGLTIWPNGSVLVDQSTVNAGHLGMGMSAGPGNASLTINDGTVNLVYDAFVDQNSSVVLQNGARLLADHVHLEGTLRGDGTVGGSLDVTPTGTVRVLEGEYLTFTGRPGGGSPAVNRGTISLIGGSIEFHDPVVNETGATVSGHGALMFNNGLTNRGAVNLSNNTEIYGEVVNGQVGAQASFGEIVVSNDATVGFHGPVIHNGTKFKVSENANVAFFGLVTGAGDFTGGGGIFFEAGYSPGNSPAWIDADVNLTYGPDSVNTMELAGHDEAQYDVVNLTNGGTLELDGTLDVELIDGFVPDPAAIFDIYRFDSGDRSGTFDVVNLPQPMLDLGFDIFYLDTSVRLMSLSAAIPEPATLNLVIFGGMLLGLFVLRRKRPVC